MQAVSVPDRRAHHSKGKNRAKRPEFLVEGPEFLSAGPEDNAAKKDAEEIPLLEKSVKEKNRHSKKEGRSKKKVPIKEITEDIPVVKCGNEAFDEKDLIAKESEEMQEKFEKPKPSSPFLFQEVETLSEEELVREAGLQPFSKKRFTIPKNIF